MKLLDNAFGIHEQALQVRQTRLETIGRNIANADTPQYKARDIKFSKVLQEIENNSLKTTSQAHLAIADGNPNPGMMYRIPFNNSFDGNTVELNIEQAQFGQAAGEYQATLNILENRVNGLKRALRGD